MKAIKYIFQGGLYLLLGLLSVSCEKTTYPEYDTAFSGIYFEEDSIRYSFGVTPLSTSSYIMELPVKIMGTPAKTDLSSRSYSEQNNRRGECAL